jgi:hypothetical protein
VTDGCQARDGQQGNQEKQDFRFSPHVAHYIPPIAELQLRKYKFRIDSLKILIFWPVFCKENALFLG